jgi:hypothetical protein
LALPFDFKYFGTNYREILVSDNGWISFDTRYWYDVRNWSLPNTWGGASQVAAFWDNLAPTAPGGDGIYAWHDEANHRFIVEWSRLRNYETYIDDFQTFEVVLLDPRYHSTASGNGEILFQYRQIVDNDWQRMYSTVGIEDPTEQFGLQYCYCGIYADGAAPLTSGLAIKITTEPPVYQPLTTRMMLAEWAPGVAAEKARGRVLVRWMLSDERPLAGLELWRMNEDGVESSAVKINDGLLDPRTAEIADPSGDPETRYRYRLVATNSFGAKRTAGEATYLGQAAGGPDLRIIGSNPMTVATSIYFRSSGTAGAKLGVYDTSGRCVRVLVQPRVNGPHAGLVPWDGRDDSGRPVGAGLYWVRLTAPRVAETARLVVLH